MADDRRKNVQWSIPTGDALTWPSVTVAVLMDIRDELQTINARMSCHRIPRALDAMIALGRRRKRKKKGVSRGTKGR